MHVCVLYVASTVCSACSLPMHAQWVSFIVACHIDSLYQTGGTTYANNGLYFIHHGCMFTDVWNSGDKNYAEFSTLGIILSACA